jgi:hypothetical protein
VKLPDPEAGTAEQPEPKSIEAALALTAGALDVMGAVVPEEAVEPDPLELHAARPPLRASTAMVAGTRRRVMRIPDMGKSLLSDMSSGYLLRRVFGTEGNADWCDSTNRSFG